MASLLYQFALKKTGLASAIKVGDAAEDPYREEIPAEQLKFYQKKGAKRKKPIPTYLSHHDQKVLRSVRNKAYNLDLAISLCGVRFGWSGIIGLIPWIGDVIALLLALNLVKKLRQAEGGLPEVVLAQMMLNITFDFAIGLIPIVGDFINIAYKANTRNYLLLERQLEQKYKVQHKGVNVELDEITAPNLTPQPLVARNRN